MNFHIRQTQVTKEIKNWVYKGFARHAVLSTGINGLAEDPIAFCIDHQDEPVGMIALQLFWEQLHIKYLFVEEPFRNQGMGRHLMEHALAYGKLKGCEFAFVETMSFQAPEFYTKMGFQIEFSRSGYAHHTTFHYLKKSLA